MAIMQTAMRVWDALLSEGAKILYRVAMHMWDASPSKVYHKCMS